MSVWLHYTRSPPLPALHAPPFRIVSYNDIPRQERKKVANLQNYQSSGAITRCMSKLNKQTKCKIQKLESRRSTRCTVDLIYLSSCVQAFQAPGSTTFLTLPVRGGSPPCTSPRMVCAMLALARLSISSLARLDGATGVRSCEERRGTGVYLPEILGIKGAQVVENQQSQFGRTALCLQAVQVRARRIWTCRSSCIRFEKINKWSR